MKRRSFATFLCVLAVGLLSSCQGQPFVDEDFNKKLFPNGPWDLIIQLAAFVILLLIVFFLGYKPLKKMLSARKEYVEKQLQEAEEAKKIVKEANTLASQEIEKGKEEAKRIIESAKAQANAEAEAIVATAKAEASDRRKAADEEIRIAKENSKQEIRKEIIDVALAASSTILGREVEAKDDDKMLQDLISSLEEGGK